MPHYNIKFDAVKLEGDDNYSLCKVQSLAPFDKLRMLIINAIKANLA